MAIFYTYSVRCRCGEAFEARLARSVNVGRSPHLRTEILEGSFHRVRCPACEATFTVEKPFTYADFRTQTFFSVRPRQERHLHRRASRELAGALGRMPKALSPEGSRTARIVFGMQELREKLVAQDAGVDDRVIELVKVYLLQEHPFLLHRPRLRLVLHEIRGDAYEFTASHDHSSERFAIIIPTAAVHDLVQRRAELESLLEERHDTSPFREHAPWVNLWRYSPQTSALEELARYTEQVRKGEPVELDTPAFKKMLSRLPRGAHLSSWAKQALLVLSRYAKERGLGRVQDALFEVRFGIALDNDWGKNADNDDIDVLWDLLKDLPESNVEGNAFIRELKLDKSNLGGWYDPSTHDIGIHEDELADRERFQDVVRHEIGHAVHEQLSDKVNAWLKQRFGWERFGNSDAEINHWVALMGGWGPLKSAERAQVRTVLRSAMGPGGNWEPPKFRKPAASHPWWKKNLGPRLAFEKSGKDFFGNHATWHRANGKAFFVNFYYGELMVMDDTTSQLVSRMLDAYAAMSPTEFFAELYALYYDLDEQGREQIPEDVIRWLEEELGKAELNARGPRVVA